MINHMERDKGGRPPADWDGRVEQILPLLDEPRMRGYIAAAMGWSATKTGVTLKRARERGLVDFTGRGATARWHRKIA